MFTYLTADRRCQEKKNEIIRFVIDMGILKTSPPLTIKRAPVGKGLHVGLVGFYGISTIVGYLIPNPFYTYILNIYDLVWLGFMTYQPL